MAWCFWSAKFWTFLFYILANVSVSSVLWAENKAKGTADQTAQRRLLGLIEYLAADYPGAVVDGKIVNASEYEEMKNFVRTALDLFMRLKGELKVAQQTEIAESLADLNACIGAKCRHEQVLALSSGIRERLIHAFGISAAPTHRPDYKLAKNVYLNRCASCHGARGGGEGPLAGSLNPKPRSFLDDSSLDFSSPLMFFDTLQNGISGTAMVSYADVLTADEMWSVSFYVMGMRYEHGDQSRERDQQAEETWQRRVDTKNPVLPMDLAFLALRSDKDLREWLQKSSPGSKSEVELAFLRTMAPYAPQIQVSNLSGPNAWNFIRSKAQEARAQFQAGLYADAEGSLLDAYLGGFEKQEAPLAVADHDLLLSVERAFLVARGFATNKDQRFVQSLTELEQLVARSQALLVQKNLARQKWHSGDFFSSLLIILREGFEAFLIIVALLMIIKNMQAPAHARQARLWIHVGWLTAVLMGLVTYLVFEKVLKLSGTARESLEAFCTAIAAVVLFYTGFWLLSQAEMSRWQSYIKAKTSHAFSTKRLWLLSGMAFIAVFREAAETVLFYAALLSSARSQVMVAAGFFSGLAILLMICVAILKFNVCMPLKKFFLGTSVFMVLLSVVLAGKAAHEFIAAGYLRASSPLSSVPMIDILGIYPFTQTLLVQSSVLVFALGLLCVFVKKKRRRRC